MHKLAYGLPVLSVESLCKTGLKMGDATAVLFDYGPKRFLVSNYHVFTGRDPLTNQLMEKNPAPVEGLRVHYRKPAQDYSRYPEISEIHEDLLDADGNPKWITFEDRVVTEEKSNLKIAIDLAILEVPKRTPYGGIPWHEPIPFELEPAEHVSIIGYPFAICDAGHLPIWLSGTVASYGAGTSDRRFFLVDARTRPSCSGSLVIHQTKGASMLKPGGTTGRFGGVSYFMGIYSGRVHNDSDIGFVWPWQLLQQLFRRAAPEVVPPVY